jgi:5'-3' exoribonuclease 1
MGVPSYFSYIIREHRKSVLSRRAQDQQKSEECFSRLYMDCNSILYDSYRDIITDKDSKQGQDNQTIEILIIAKTIDKIKEYIRTVSPTDILFIAFDGVAPFAKMEQQRNRRYKSWFESVVIHNMQDSPQTTFSSCIFTPGTEFMKTLSTHIQLAFSNKENLFHIRKIVVSTSESFGEGEHKLFQHIRENPETNPVNKIAIYGLDADLIMLSLFHIPYCEHLYVFREAPEFMKNQISILDESSASQSEKDLQELWFLNITKLSHSITSEMRCSCPSPFRVYDYVFLCFFLGNDFLPHFPALNIRTHGMQRLLDTYRQCIGAFPHRFLLSTTSQPPKIQWSYLSLLIKQLAKNEHTFLLQECALRKKWDNRAISSYPQKTQKEKEELFQMTPVLYREEEKYINPSEPFWEDRYYKRLFPNYLAKKEPDSSMSDDDLPEYNQPTSDPIIRKETADICVNYLEGLEWVLSYYTSDCNNFRWKYRCSYPPLLVDLSPLVPKYHVSFLPTDSKPIPFSPCVQLAYVLPFSQLHLLPLPIYQYLMEKYSHLYIRDESKLTFQWSYCRYFWESHVVLPEIPLSVLLEWESSFSGL